MKLRYIKTDPTKNVTVLVETPVPRADQAHTAEKIMALQPDCEQVGFIEASESCQARLQMMGGEFCGNASISLAAVLAARGKADEGRVALEVSGTEKPVDVNIWREKDGWRGSVSMPLPTAIREMKLDGYTVPLVCFPGIIHGIVTGGMSVDTAESLIRQWGEKSQADAFGIMLLDREKGCLTPVVYVRSTDTVVRESSCASGTAAVGAWLAADRGGAELTLSEPGGSMTVSARAKNGTVVDLTLTGSVAIVDEGYIPI